MTTTVLIKAKPGQDVYDFAAQLVRMAWEINSTIYGQFNQYLLEAKPGMTRDDVAKPWDDEQRRSYLSR
jgi:hypothetical protein